MTPRTSQIEIPFKTGFILTRAMESLCRHPMTPCLTCRSAAVSSSPADFDRDGDLDLFVGGRTIPGSYPLTPQSALLRNDGGKFVDVTEEMASGLQSAGMVTSAIWSDADGDGWSDLLVTCEWGPVQLWRNDNGHLSDATRRRDSRPAPAGGMGSQPATSITTATWIMW